MIGFYGTEAMAENAGNMPLSMTALVIPSDQFSEEEIEALDMMDVRALDNHAVLATHYAKRIVSALGRAVMVREDEESVTGDWAPTDHSFMVEAE